MVALMIIVWNLTCGVKIYNRKAREIAFTDTIGSSRGSQAKAGAAAFMVKPRLASEKLKLFMIKFVYQLLVFVKEKKMKEKIGCTYDYCREFNL